MKFFQAVIKNPLTGIVFTLFIAVIIFFLSKNVPSPSYAVLHTETLAKITDNIPNLKLLWNDAKISDLRKIQLVFWNRGRKYIDKNNISETDPVRVKIPNNIRVIYHGIDKTSRPSLTFTTTENSKGILIKINGDEALERRDGGIIDILFTGEPKGNFTIEGRIKGSPEGFKKYEWFSIISGSGEYAAIISLSLILLYILYMILKTKKEDLISREEFFRRKAWILLIPGILVIFFMIFALIIQTLKVYHSLSWVTINPSFLTFM